MSGTGAPVPAATPDAADAGRGTADGQDDTPRLRLDGFEGPLDLLLELARAQRVDWARLSITTLVDQFVAAVEAALGATPLARVGDWLVAAAWLALLRSRLLLPQDPVEAQAAQGMADRLAARLRAAADARSLAAWLGARDMLGCEVFARAGAALAVPQGPVPQASGPRDQEPRDRRARDGEGDVLDLLLACFDVFDGAPSRTRLAYRPPLPPLHTLPEALARLRERLRQHPAGGPLWRFLLAGRDGQPAGADVALQARSNVAATFLAGLELARDGSVALEQAEAFGTLQVRRAG